MNPINPYGSSIPGPSQGPAEGGGKSDPLRGVGESSQEEELFAAVKVCVDIKDILNPR